MRSNIFTLIVAAICLAFTTLAAEESKEHELGNHLILDNGSEAVSVTLEQRGGESLSCSGSSQCKHMSPSDCDAAKRQIQPNNRYFTGGNKGATGVCSGRCGLFVSGSNCDLFGWEMNTAFDQLRAYGCRICGLKTYDDGCQFKMDVVTGC